MAEFRKKRKKVCYMCMGKPVDYKDINVITKYINENPTKTAAAFEKLIFE